MPRSSPQRPSGEGIPLLGRQYSLGIQWHNIGGENIDLDLQAVIVDSNGLIVDAVYYNNLTAMDGAVGSGGDDSHAAGCSQENIWVSLSKLPADISLVVFVVCAHNQHSLRDVYDGKIVLKETSGMKEILKMDIERCMANVDIVGMMKRDAEKSSWRFVEIDDPAEEGSHFLDVLEPNIGDLIRSQIPHAPRRQSICFHMQKGSNACLPGEGRKNSSSLGRLSILMDADVSDTATKAVDIDIVAVFYGESGDLLGAADCVSEQMFGVSHSGALQYEHDEHIQESLVVDLAQVPDKVTHIFLILTNMHGTFEQIDHLRTSIIDEASHELARLQVPAGHNESGLILARLFCRRTRLSKRWALHAVGTFFSHHGATWSGQSAQHEMIKVLHNVHPDKVALPKQQHHHHHHDKYHHGKSASASGDPAAKQEDASGQVADKDTGGEPAANQAVENASGHVADHGAAKEPTQDGKMPRQDDEDVKNRAAGISSSQAQPDVCSVPSADLATSPSKPAPLMICHSPTTSLRQVTKSISLTQRRQGALRLRPRKTQEEVDDKGAMHKAPIGMGFSTDINESDNIAVPFKDETEEMSKPRFCRCTTGTEQQCRLFGACQTGP